MTTYDTETVEAAAALLEIRRRASQQAATSEIWVPRSKVQQAAIDSPAQELFYGGAAGGGKSDLLLGLALTKHYRSLILRREFPTLTAVIERSRELLQSTKASYNAQAHFWRGIPAPKIRQPDGTIFHQTRTLEFGSVKNEDDKSKYQGRDHGLKGFDELPQFSPTQYTFIIGWNRAVNPYERERIVATGNPPLTAEEAWVIKYFGPWLDARYKGNGGPAKPGELRWFTVIDGKDTEVDAGSEFTYKGITVRPRSRTFLPARLTDNNILLQRGYADVLNSMPEPLRSLLLFGDYNADYALQDDPWQVIPSAWYDAAVERWRAAQNQLPSFGLTRIGVDAATTNDRFVIARLFGNYFDELIVHPGSSTPDGIAGARKVVEALGLDPDVINMTAPTAGMYAREIPLNIDIIGPGSDVAGILRDRGFTVFGMHGNAASHFRDQGGYMKMLNLRAEMYWRFREALDPTYGDGLMIPDDEELREEMLAPRWEATPHGVQIEDKIDLRKRLGRSPDKADALVQTYIDMAARKHQSVPNSSSGRAGFPGMAYDPGATAHQTGHTGDKKRRKDGSTGRRSLPDNPYPDGPPTTQSTNVSAHPVPVRGPDGEIRYVWEPYE
jgi:hypothetical protein